MLVLQFWPNWTMIPNLTGRLRGDGQSIAHFALVSHLTASCIKLDQVWVTFAIAACDYLFGFVGRIMADPLASEIGAVIRFAAQQILVGPCDSISPCPPAPK